MLAGRQLHLSARSEIVTIGADAGAFCLHRQHDGWTPTPLANLEGSSGPHEVVFTRSRFPVHRMKIAVTSGKPPTVKADAGSDQPAPDFVTTCFRQHRVSRILITHLFSANSDHLPLGL